MGEPIQECCCTATSGPEPLQPLALVTGHRLNCPKHQARLAELKNAGLILEADSDVAATCLCSDPSRGPLAHSGLTGHRFDCPVHARILRDYHPGDALPGVSAAEGTTVWIWAPQNGMLTFVPFRGSCFRFEVSVPAGWSFAAHPALGVVLVGPGGENLSANRAYELARESQRGFRFSR